MFPACTGSTAATVWRLTTPPCALCSTMLEGAAAMGGPSDDPRDDGATEQQRPFTAVVDLTTQEKASLLCGDNADEVYSRCEVRAWPEQCAAAKTERRWQLRGMSSSRHLNTLRDVKGADRSPQVTGPISGFGTFSFWVQDFDAVYRT
ncbi:hypothetical protein M885DRAFT_624943, partial [Pelagophyceae sp. CCMP2097]